MIAAAQRLDSHDSILNALPHPVVSIAADGMIVDGNAAAEGFFQASIAVLRRHMLKELVPFGSPLLALVDQVRERHAPVNEYKVDLGTPRNGHERIVDIYVAPLAERPGDVVVMLQERIKNEDISARWRGAPLVME